ncbi:hypothetical protein [Streptomyces sp. NPDC093260]|uniref:hypothetical protein n=1 Tax=Streptomyces sp. NPDC093260 TaxID=3155073 RepID=UPI00342CD546
MPEADHDSFEERFTDVLRDTGAALDTSRRDLAAEGAARGRRLVARRRAVVAGGVAAVALVAVGGALVLPAGQGGDDRQQSAAGSPKAGIATTAAETNASQPAVSAASLLETFGKLLSGGKLTQTDGRGTDDHPYVRGVYDDGRGEGAVTVGINRVPVGTQEALQTTQCPDKVFIAYDSCSTTKLADGSALMILKGYEYPDKRGGTKLWRAELVTPTGQFIEVQEWNAAAEKEAPVTRPEPPLSAARLTQLATAPEWRTAADAIPASQWPKPAPNEPKGPTGSVSATLAGLLPKGVEIVGKGNADPQFGYVVVDDGKGASLVQVDDQPDMRDVEGELFGAGAKVLPDGTKVVTRKTAGDKDIAGIVMWTVDTIRPGGRRVVISAFNSGAQNTEPTRKTPALTLRQLEKIATDPKWNTLN